MTVSSVSDRALIISSDGHAMAHMEDYRPYLPIRLHEEFDAFCEVYRDHGARSSDPAALAFRTDPEVVEQWKSDVVDSDRLAGISDPHARLRQQERCGFVAEVLFPDFGLPFEIGPPTRTSSFRHQRTPDQIDAANRAHNRWLADFCSLSPGRFAAMACVSFGDVEAAVEEIRWAHEAGLKGVMLPHFDDEVPLYDPRFEPIWNTVEELGMPLNSHAGSSSITTRLMPSSRPLPHAGSAIPLSTVQLMFFCHQILHHLIWGGVLERHPDMKVVFTEQGSGWVVGEVQSMDYSYEGSYLRHDVHELVRRKPSEYFARQCSLGSSMFSHAEIEARHQIGIDKMAIGMDYPHHEGAWAAGPGVVAYLQATMGAAGVPPDEARMLLANNAAKVWGFDLDDLGLIAAEHGPSLAEMLTPPAADFYPRGDVHKPLGTANAGAG